MPCRHHARGDGAQALEAANNMNTIQYYDLGAQRRHESIGSLLPDWQGRQETVVLLVPHDDDAVLGAGYLIHAVQAAAGRVGVVLFCNGCAGYSRQDLASTIVDIRRREMAACLAALDIPPDMLCRLEFPDFSAHQRVGWQLLDGHAGTFELLLRQLRRWRVTRLAYANGYLEHIDHCAVELAALYDGPQVGDPVAVELGRPSPIRTYLSYSCWGDFSPMDALLANRDLSIRANWAIAVPQAVEDRMQNAIRQFQSQGAIIESLLQARRRRLLKGAPVRYVELYLRTAARPPFDHGPYRDLIADIDSRP